MSDTSSKLDLRAELAKIRASAERRSPSEKAQASMLAHRLQAHSTNPADVAAVRARRYWN